MFSIMNGKMVVSNLRIKREDWLQLKVFAAEEGMSINEYVNFMIQDYAKKKQFPKKVGKRSIWDLSRFEKIPIEPMGELSEDDKAIYGG